MGEVGRTNLIFLLISMCQIEPKSPRGCPDMRYSFGEFFQRWGIYLVSNL